MPHRGGVLVIIDGLGDVSSAAFNSRTASQLAETPMLDKLVAAGRGGLMDPIRPGVACGSDTAHLSMFGYESEKVYRGRGALETVGTGVEMQPGDVAFKCNLALLDARGVVVKRCASKAPEFVGYARTIAAALNGLPVPGHPGVAVTVKHAVDHRLVVCLRGAGLSDAITDTDPLTDGKPLFRAAPTCGAPDARHTAEVVNALSDALIAAIAAHPATHRRRMAGLPVANVVLLRGAATQICVAPFAELHGLCTFLIAPTKIIAGIGITASMDIVKVPGATAGFDTNLIAKAAACARKLCERADAGEGEGVRYKYDLGILHVKAVDEASHHKDVQLKAQWLEKVDAMVDHLLGLLRKEQRRELIFAITGDHTTIAEHGDHTCEPVPVVFTDLAPILASDNPPGPTIAPDNATRFDEVDIGTHASIGRFGGIHLMRIIRQLIA